jgi:hypothetical protein
MSLPKEFAKVVSTIAPLYGTSRAEKKALAWLLPHIRKKRLDGEHPEARSNR